MEKPVIEKTFLNSEVPKALARQASITAAIMGVSRSELVRQALADYLKRLDTKSEARNERQPA